MVSLVYNDAPIVTGDTVEVPSQVENTIDYDSEMMFKPERQENETFEAYKMRRTHMNLIRKFKVRGMGQVLWNSSKQGTYIKKRHGELML